jgi:Mg-chelatase subunit ChlD
MKKNKNIKLTIIAVVFICIIFSRANIFAKSLNEVAPETLAVTLVIDTSGSMATTDPEKLRQTAANIFIDLLSPEDYLSIITFNTKKEVVLPMQQIKSNNNKANFKKSLSQKLQSIGDTDYLIALNEASKQLSTVKEAKVRKVILFLTDGEPDPDSTKKNNPKFMNQYMESLWKAVSKLALNKYEVYSVGFSKGVDPAILERISSSTGGTFKIYEDSSKLALSFSEISREVKKPKEIASKTLEVTPKPISPQPPEKLLTKSVSNNLYLTFLGIFVGVSLLIILLGLLLNRLLVYKNTIIQGKLKYWKESDTNAKDKDEFDFNKLGKGKLAISFNAQNKDAEYHIFHNEYDYDIELTYIMQMSRWKFIEGFKALFHRSNSSELVLKTTEPGIFIYEDKVYTSKKIYRDDKFITGGYVFQYSINHKGKSTYMDKGKDLL